MKLGKVIGRVTLSVACPAFKGARWLIINPSDRKTIKAISDDMASSALSPRPSPVVYDDLGAGMGDIIGYVEGAEAAAPFENPTPVDAINTAIIDQVFYKPFES